MVRDIREAGALIRLINSGSYPKSIPEMFYVEQFL